MSTPMARTRAGPDLGGRHPGIRSGHRLRPGERAVDLACRVAGSWPYAALLVAAIVAGTAVAVSTGAVAVLGLGLSTLALLEVTLVLMAARRAQRTATEVAIYHLDQARRSAAATEELRGEVQRLHADLAWIAARTEKASHHPDR
jgi:uncharacterized membrane protein